VTTPQLDHAEPGVFSAAEVDALVEFFEEHGYATLRGAYSDEELCVLESDLERQQRRLVAGELPERHGTVILDDPDARVDGVPFAHYVCHVTECSQVAEAAVHHAAVVTVVARLLGSGAWLLDDDRFGVVYQDARPGEGSGYSRIGWHSDFQSGPHLPIWPSVAFTIHIDATSPANGFLRVVPGSHRLPADSLPPSFEKIRGEVAVYAERGDVLFHHSDLWHGAARATADGALGVRRHVRGGWYAGERLAPNHGVDDFVKNAAR
jgi:ectoine hydroxylase-related dioxygenase (phytanoyl-CoA dioxygenase family)